MSKKHKKHRPAEDPSVSAEASVKTMSRSRKRLFTLSLSLIPFFVLALVETGLRVFHYGEDTDLFISAPGALGFPYDNNVMFPRILQIRQKLGN